MFGAEERLVALDVDVDIGVVELGYGVETVRAASEIRGGEFDGDIEAAAEIDNLFGVGSDDDLVELRADASGVDDPGEERPPRDFTQNFARQAGGC